MILIKVKRNDYIKVNNNDYNLFLAVIHTSLHLWFYSDHRLNSYSVKVLSFSHKGTFRI